MASVQIKYLDPLVVSKLKNIEVKARLIVEGFITGLHKSPYHGFSVEFAEHRPYNTGEPLRNIDWKVFAKSDKLYVKRYEEETNMRCHIVLDVSDSMRYPVDSADTLSKIEYGAYLTAALSYLMISQKDAAGLTLFDENIQYFSPPKAKLSYLVPMFVKLQEVVNERQLFTHKTATAQALHQIAAKIQRRGFVVLITDLFTNMHEINELFPALQRLRHSNHEVLIFHLLDKKTEEFFNFPNQPLILKDLETGEEIRVQPEQIKNQYRTIMSNFIEQVKKKCRELQVDFFEIDIQKPYDKALLDYVVKRKQLVK